MKKLFYVFAVAFLGLVVACGNANNSNTAEETVVEETVVEETAAVSDSTIATEDSTATEIEMEAEATEE